MAVIEDQIHEHEANTNTLYNDIVEQILRNLPVKSLLRFKAVCKSWFNLISNPRFDNLTICRDHNVSRIHLSGYNCSYRVELGEIERDAFHEEVHGNEGLPWYFSVPSIDADCSDIQAVEIGNPFDDLCSIHIAGSCNGVLFVTIRDDTFLWNPSIREHVQLPPTNAMHDLFCDYCNAYRDCGTFRTFAGLGYNSVFDEYKAILFIVEYSDEDQFHRPNIRSQLLIYSSKVGRWKEVDEDVPYCFCKTLDLGVTVNGCPHWIVHDSKDYKYSRPMIILYFDTVDDKFKRLPTSIKWCDYYYDEHEVGASPSLSVLGRCLCAALNNLIHNTTDVWVMNEYGVEDSWNKLFVIPDSIIQGDRIVPLGFMNHGDELVLEVNKEKIMTYNRKTEAQKFVIGTTTNRFFPPSRNFNSVDYVTSSVSPCRFLRDEKQKQEEKKGVS